MAKPIAPDPFWNWQDEPARALFIEAAKGNVDAQAGLAEGMLAKVLEKRIDRKWGIESALFWARAAVVHGRVYDQRNLATLLIVWADIKYHEGEQEIALLAEGEAIVILDRLADLGDDTAESILAAASSKISQAGFALARRAREEMKATAGGEA